MREEERAEKNQSIQALIVLRELCPQKGAPPPAPRFHFLLPGYQEPCNRQLSRPVANALGNDIDGRLHFRQVPPPSPRALQKLPMCRARCQVERAGVAEEAAALSNTANDV